MTELEKQWRREENLKLFLVIVVASSCIFLGLAVIAHSIDLLGVKCSL